MTPREFIESLRSPLGARSRLYGTWTDAATLRHQMGEDAAEPQDQRPPKGKRSNENEIRLQEIDGWIWAEGKWPRYGAGGLAFVKMARLHVEKGDFIEWLNQLKPKTPQPPKE